MIDYNSKLPSSSLLREDLNLLKKNDLGEAQKWKDELEKKQREDRKLRQKWKNE